MELKDATILVVDDESTLLDIFREWLEEQGCRVLTAGEGAAALEILLHQHVDVIVSDVRMPVMDGVLLLTNLTFAGTSRLGYAPRMIFITGFTDVEPRDAYDLGVELILQKPVKHDQFVGAVRQSLRPCEETWAETQSLGGPLLHVELPCISAALEQGLIAFGRGGFCVRCSAPIREGPIRFEIEFQGGLSIAGHGFIRWTDMENSLIGLEILNLDDGCRKWAIGLITANAGSSYIPRTPIALPGDLYQCNREYPAGVGGG